MTTVELKLLNVVRHLFRVNWMCNQNKWAFLLKILLFVRGWGEGAATTQRRV